VSRDVWPERYALGTRSAEHGSGTVLRFVGGLVPNQSAPKLVYKLGHVIEPISTFWGSWIDNNNGILYMGLQHNEVRRMDLMKGVIHSLKTRSLLWTSRRIR